MIGFFRITQSIGQVKNDSRICVGSSLGILVCFLHLAQYIEGRVLKDDPNQKLTDLVV